MSKALLSVKAVLGSHTALFSRRDATYGNTKTSFGLLINFLASVTVVTGLYTWNLGILYINSQRRKQAADLIAFFSTQLRY